ncbi:MAG: septation regulator SpoVG [Candidatus Eisenbacteria bacterium]|nr:septation regulator SpoVG [Candidatus Eisenbacteria bacterium]
MEITEVRVTIRPDDRLKAFASVTFDDCFVVHGLKVIEGNNGLFVAMPSRRRSDGTYQDIAHPINNEMRALVEDRVLGMYRDQLTKAGSLSGSIASS